MRVLERQSELGSLLARHHEVARETGRGRPETGDVARRAGGTGRPGARFAGACGLGSEGAGADGRGAMGVRGAPTGGIHERMGESGTALTPQAAANSTIAPTTLPNNRNSIFS